MSDNTYRHDRRVGIIKYLKKYGTGKPRDTVAFLNESKRDALQKVLRQMVRFGHIVSDDKGNYRLQEATTEAPVSKEKPPQEKASAAYAFSVISVILERINEMTKRDTAPLLTVDKMELNRLANHALQHITQWKDQYDSGSADAN